MINVNDLFRDEVQKADRKELANELVYLYTEFDGMGENEALNNIIELTDEELEKQVNVYYEGTGMIYKLVK